jgi:NADH-quinone oxidoreductase subunit M
MNVSLILIILLVGAFATYLAGNKLASKVALIFSLAAAGCSVVLLNHYKPMDNITKSFLCFAS